jgi:FtsP/CotA-like multicopper oxidase with cupredoxin domain
MPLAFLAVVLPGTLLFAMPHGDRASERRVIEQIRINDNRTPAGTLEDGVLTVRLEARRGEWHPDRDADPGVVVEAFGEEGKPLSIPGPMLRVTEGTEIRALVRNSLDTATLVVRGLYDRAPGSSPAADTIVVAAGTVREVRFKAHAAGTYYYWGSIGARNPQGVEIYTLMSGAFIVDKPGAAAFRERVLLIGSWRDVTPGVPTVIPGRIVINGKAWPNTERLTYDAGDSIRWRVLNVSNTVHPMHLHGFYFAVKSRGNERADSIYATNAAPHLVVTERLSQGRTMSMVWVPERPGNWLFHCHDNVHIRRNQPLDGSQLPPENLLHAENHALEMMGGPVMGVHVRPRGGMVAASEPAARRHIRLSARVDKGGTDEEPAFGYVLEDGVRAPASGPPYLPGPTIVLKRGEPVTITVVNELPEPTAVHWHGIELESYFDGVAGFAGQPGRIAPPIAPRDSFEARFTPPRAGTFIYHTHIDEVRQQRAGLAGALIVLDPGTTYDPSTDVVLLLTTPRRVVDNGVIFLNGSSTPKPLEWRAGTRYRLRVINVHTARPSMIVYVKRETETLAWRAIAKDGADLPAERATVRPAQQQMGNGEAYDFEFTPDKAGDLRIEVTAANGTFLVSMPIHVR